MNIAFSTLIILFIAIPGIVFRRSYFSSSFSLNYISSNLINEIIWSLIPSILFHAVFIMFIEYYTPFIIRFDILGLLILGTNDFESINRSFGNIHDFIKEVLLYFIFITFIASLIGHCFRWIVRWFRLDIVIPFLKYSNRWHYFFTAEYLDSLSDLKKSSTVSFVMVDVLVNTVNTSIIYSGLAEDYFLSRTSEGLDRIIIKYPMKKEFTTDGDGDFIDIPGDYLSIPYSKIENINFRYMMIEQDMMAEQNNLAINDDLIIGLIDQGLE